MPQNAAASAAPPNAARPPRSRRPSVLAKVALLAFSLLFALGSLEAGMRILGVKPHTATVLSTYFQQDAQTGWRGRPNAQCRFTTSNFDVFVTHDASGYRHGRYDAPLAADATAPHPVAWVLGDSGTWGWGVPDGKTYVDLLDASSPDGTRYRNLGHCGFSSVQQWLLLKELFAAGHRPDEVFVLFCANDLGENLDDKDQQPPRPYLAVVDGRAELRNYPTPPAAGLSVLTWLKNNSLVWNHAHYHAMRAKGAWRERLAAKSVAAAPAVVGPTQPGPAAPAASASSEVRPSFAHVPETPELIALREAYRGMRDLCREHGVRLIVLGHGYTQAELGRACEQLDITLIDGSRRWRRHWASAEAASRRIDFPTDPHNNEYGHQLLAEGFREDLASLQARAGAAVAERIEESSLKTR
ncbi:MAG: SGNH/GDSL hydrolase family protein [Planctomycetaceae bacterium]|nr:SGNH/GDSL hydrolase family protein [Planctomycetaceae bacterium]